LANIVNRLLEKKPEKRFQSAEEVESLLRSCLADWQSGKRDMPRIVEHTKRFAKQLQPYAKRLHPSRFDLKKVKGWLPSASLSRQLTLVLTVLHIVAIAISTVAAFLEVESILFSGPVVGVALGGALAALAWIAKLPKRFIAFGASSIAATLLIVAVIGLFGLSPGDWIAICSLILTYAALAIPCGIVLVRQLWWFRDLDSERLSLTGDSVVIPLLGSLLFVIGLAGPIVAVANESVFVALPTILLVGSFATVVCLLSDRHWLTKAFAVSAPTMAFLVAFSLVSYMSAGPNTPTSALISWGVVWVVLAYVFFAVPLGIWVILKESNLLTEFKMEKLSILHGLAITALLALAMAMARPSLNFGIPAYLASSLFGVVLFGIAGVSGLWLTKQMQTKKLSLVWFGVAVATFAFAIAFMSGMKIYDAEANYGYLIVRVNNTSNRFAPSPLATPIRLSLTDEDGTTHTHELRNDVSRIGPFPRGVAQVRLLTGSDIYKLESKEVDLEFRSNDLAVELRSTGDS
ncbi:MAG: hypothetical protein AAGG44_15935, partial [Planctomycetota bacterium]